MSSRKFDEIWEKLAQETSRKAGDVKCSPAEYRSGLKHIIAALEVDILASEECDNDDR